MRLFWGSHLGFLFLMVLTTIKSNPARANNNQRQQWLAQVLLTLWDKCTDGAWRTGKGMPGRRNGMCKGPKARVGTLEEPGQTVRAENYYSASPGIPSHVPLKSMPEVTLLKS